MGDPALPVERSGGARPWQAAEKAQPDVKSKHGRWQNARFLHLRSAICIQDASFILSGGPASLR
jgi:hypothetical protein